ncbi:MAG: HD domain-containing protein [Clostridia bacterium]|nr:HD domain-containing protein [Clostridia bacterium]
MTYSEIRADAALRTYIAKADTSLKALSFTEHSFPHASLVASRAGEVLHFLDYPERLCELARIAGFLHDIGNLVNREEHSQSGAVMVFRLLLERGFAPEEVAEIVTAIGNHDEGCGIPVSPLAAALILADKSDVRRSRVRQDKDREFDIHDRVNFSVTESALSVEKENATVTLTLSIDPAISSVMDYFEIFHARMKLCRRAAQTLGLTFRLVINGQAL